MIYTDDEIKILVLKETDAEEYGGDWDVLYPIWQKGLNAAGKVDDVFVAYVKRNMLKFLQGQFRKKYNQSRGQDKKDLAAQFQNVTRMLQQAEADIERLDPNAGVPPLGIAHIENHIPQACGLEPDGRHGGGRYGFRRRGGKNGCF